MKEIRIALLGMGRIGKIHFRNIRQHFTNATIVAVADPQLDLAVSRQQYPDIFFSNDPAEVIARGDVNAVLICTPTSSHASLIEQAIRGDKAVFCEKPMDL